MYRDHKHLDPSDEWSWYLSPRGPGGGWAVGGSGLWGVVAVRDCRRRGSEADRECVCVCVCALCVCTVSSWHHPDDSTLLMLFSPAQTNKTKRNHHPASNRDAPPPMPTSCMLAHSCTHVRYTHCFIRQTPTPNTGPPTVSDTAHASCRLLHTTPFSSQHLAKLCLQ